MPRRLPVYRPGVRMIHISEPALYWVGFVLVCLSAFSGAVIQRGILRLGVDASLEDLRLAMQPGGGAMGWVTGAVMCSLASTLALPLFARLVVEAAKRTEDQRELRLLLGACAVISEVPYDWALNGKWWDPAVQNPVWGLLVSEIMIAIFQRWTLRSRGADIAFKAVVTLAAVLWALLLQVHLGPIMVLLSALFYFAYRAKKEWVAMAGGALLTLIQFPAPLGLALVHWYDGEKKAPYGLFCILYPLQLVVFGALGALI